jgi:hypothetical protein
VVPGLLMQQAAKLGVTPDLVRLLERLAAKIGPPDANGCRLWTGCQSSNAMHPNNPYGLLRVAGAERVSPMRVNRLIALLVHAPEECPREATEPIDQWLKRANRYYCTQQAAHTCDVSLCSEPSHLVWRDGPDQVFDQRVRQLLHGRYRRKDVRHGSRRSGARG